MRVRPLAILLLAATVILPAQALQEKKDDGPQKDEKKGGKDLPLEGARSVSFPTEEGSWMSLDVSPDGKTVLFELLGDLYTVGMGGGQARRITDGMAFDSQPRYSPDGSRIVFISDRSGADNLWIANADGSDPKAVTKEKTQ
ncbi:MAG TPA: hypothetical protein VE379_04860, partial [Vicinamibacterales bacterium]|nr:hypothetical protein [Vicinamibacterales bacterium]